MKNLNENIQRIKQMMNTINESSFDKPMIPEITPEVRQGITDVLNGFIQNPEFDDYDLNVNGGNFYIGDGEGVFYLEYDFSIYYSSRSSFTPGRMYMDNGDPGYPDEGEPARRLPLHRRGIPLQARGRGPDPHVCRRGRCFSHQYALQAAQQRHGGQAPVHCL